MRRCVTCGTDFEPTTKKGYQCPPCRREYDAAWRERRRAAGLASSGSDTWDPKKKEAWKELYYKRTDVRARNAIRMRGYSKDPVLAVRHKARMDVRNALRRGLLSRLPCRDCGSELAQAHHPDYSKPLEVVWLCRRHHDAEHAKAEGK